MFGFLPTADVLHSNNRTIIKVSTVIDAVWHTSVTNLTMSDPNPQP